jgi:hypothetical protein
VVSCQIEPHISRLTLALFDNVEGHSSSGRVLSDDGCKRLGMTKLIEGGLEGTGHCDVVDEGSKFGSSSGGQDLGHHVVKIP